MLTHSGVYVTFVVVVVVVSTDNNYKHNKNDWRSNKINNYQKMMKLPSNRVNELACTHACNLKSLHFRIERDVTADDPNQFIHTAQMLCNVCKC